jgi:hypothetical protein
MDMNKNIKIAIATTLVGATIGGTLIGVNNLTTKYNEPIRKTTIVKTNENAVRIDYKEIILEELVTTKQIIVATNRMRIPFTHTEKYFMGERKQDVEFSAVGKFIVDLDKLNSEDILIDDASQTVTIYMTKPIKEVNLLENETKFGDIEKSWYLFNKDIEYSLEQTENIKHQVKCDALTLMIDLEEQAKECARESIQGIIRMATNKNYTINIRWVS